jgi:hypothetical protein
VAGPSHRYMNRSRGPSQLYDGMACYQSAPNQKRDALVLLVIDVAYLVFATNCSMESRETQIAIKVARDTLSRL